MGALRLFLALSVVVWHMPGRSVGLVDAGVAVVLFFIISGFYMALVVNESYAGEPGRFWIARLLRIFPPYLAMCAVMVAWFTLRPSPNVFTGMSAEPFPGRPGLIFLNLGLIGQDLFEAIVESLRAGEHNLLQRLLAGLAPVGFYDDRWMLVGQAWSLGSELLFYALAPFAVRSTRRLALLLAASLAVRWIMIFGLGYSSAIWGYRFFPATVCLFVLGSLGYHLYARIRRSRMVKPIGALVTWVFGISAIALVWRYGKILPIDPARGYDAPHLLFVYLGVAAALPFLFARWRDSAVDRWLGELSYPLYIVHGLTVGIVYFIWGMQGQTAVATALVFSLAAAAAMYAVVDRPIDRWRHRRLRRSPAPETAVATSS